MRVAFIKIQNVRWSVSNPFEKSNLLAILQTKDKEHAIHLEPLSNLAHLDSRQVKEYIRQFRLEGIGIGGDTYCGYFIAKSVDDLDGIINSIKASMITRQQTIKSLEKTRLAMLRDGSMDGMFK